MKQSKAKSATNLNSFYSLKWRLTSIAVFIISPLPLSRCFGGQVGVYRLSSSCFIGRVVVYGKYGMFDKELAEIVDNR